MFVSVSGSHTCRHPDGCGAGRASCTHARGVFGLVGLRQHDAEHELHQRFAAGNRPTRQTPVISIARHLRRKLALNHQVVRFAHLGSG